ncbi:hypothetical protein GGI00_005008 [Coemansia sp. RSA 2681]|nr:hypothetical protein GGI00_005008 [Coemansia sp. RSA 2681]
MQSWMWRHMRANSELLHGAFDDDDDDDEVLLLYGSESDDEGSEGEYSDSFLREIHADQLETSKQWVRLETVEQERMAEVRRIMKQQLALFFDEWVAKKQPRLELHASYLWRRHNAGRSHLEQRLARIEGERLPKAQDAVVDSGVSRKADIVKLCGGLRLTLDELLDVAWLLDLTAGPQPLSLRQHQLSLTQAPDRGPHTC